MTDTETGLAAAQAAVVQRVTATLADLGEEFPHWASAETGEWRTTYTGDWTNGAWPGLLWLAGYLDSDEALSAAAARWSRKLAPVADADTAFKGFTFYYGAALGSILADDPEAAEIGIRCANSLAAMFQPSLGLIPLGSDAQEHSDVGPADSSIDSLQASPLLIWAASLQNDPVQRDTALRHTRRVLENHVRADGSVIQSSRLDPDTGAVISTHTHKGYSDTSVWGRAQAWAMLYSSMVYAECPDAEDILDQARIVSDWWLANVPEDGVAFWDFDDPTIPNTARDTAATAIAAAALLKLSAVETDPGRARRYEAGALRAVESLVSLHVTPVNEHDARPVGMLVDGCFTKRPDARAQDAVTNAELIFGDYFLLECLAVLSGRIGATDV